MKTKTQLETVYLNVSKSPSETAKKRLKTMEARQGQEMRATCSYQQARFTRWRRIRCARLRPSCGAAPTIVALTLAETPPSRARGSSETTPIKAVKVICSRTVIFSTKQDTSSKVFTRRSRLLRRHSENLLACPSERHPGSTIESSNRGSKKPAALTLPKSPRRLTKRNCHRTLLSQRPR